MTIALGVLAGDGLVVAADTEENDGYFKRTQTKVKGLNLQTITVPYDGADISLMTATDSGAFVISGAGDASYITDLSEELSLICSNNVDAEDEVFRREIKKALVPYYTQHVLPLLGLPPNERPELSLLIGVIGEKKEPRLFATERLSVNRFAGYAAVGAGRLFVETLLKKLHPWDSGLLIPFSIEAAARLAAYVLWQARDLIPGVGGKHTEMWILHNHTKYSVSWEAVRAMETVFLKHEYLEGAAMAFAFATDAKMRRYALSALKKEFAAFTRDYAHVAIEFPPPIGKRVLQGSKRGRKGRTP